VKKVALLILVVAGGCSGGGGPNVDAELEKRGFEVVSCRETGEAARFICQLKSGRQVQGFIYEGEIFVVKAV
jgi:hypothetical protein